MQSRLLTSMVFPAKYELSMVAVAIFLFSLFGSRFGISIKSVETNIRNYKGVCGAGSGIGDTCDSDGDALHAGCCVVL